MGRRLLFVVLHGLLFAVVSLVLEIAALGKQALAVVAGRLSCHVACGIFSGQGSNLCPLH